MLQLGYDNVIVKIIDNEEIEYGILYGNANIVFIKVGADGSIRGYQDKYLKMAHRVHNRLGATVVCASNPYIEHGHLDADQAMISKVAAECGFSDYEVCFVGTSDGSYRNLLLAQQVPHTVKLLGINPSLSTTDDLLEQLRKIPQVKKVLVYGTEDEDFECVPLLQASECENLEIITVEGANHEFAGMMDEFIALIDLI